MTGATRLALDLPAATRHRLDELARRTARPQAALAHEAVEGYLDRELAIVAAIERGLDDRTRGHVTPHDEAMARIRETIESAGSSN